MDEYFVLYLLLGIGLLLILYSFQRNYLNFLEKSRKNEYYIKKARIKRRFEDEDDDGNNEIEPSNIQIPIWLQGILSGMGIDTDKLLSGDEKEINKLQPIISKILGKGKGKESDSGDSDFVLE